MYNTKHLRQIEASRRHLFGNSGEPPSQEVCAMYVLPASLEVVPCHEGPNGEWIADEASDEQ